MILIISLCKEKLSEFEFVDPIKKIIPGAIAKNYREITKKDLANADKILLTGTALKDFEYLAYNFSWIKDFKKPVLGICAGMQVIAKEHNLLLENSASIGVKNVDIIQENILAKDSFQAYFLHTKNSWGNFTILAKNQGVPCMIKHPEKEIYGCIFHPEVLNSQIITAFTEA